MPLFRDKPRGLTRLLLRLPIYLYRLDLGWLLGHRFLMLTHQGRKTGLLRQTVVEVIRYDPLERESIVLAALGERADWYRNIQARPPLEVQTGRARYVPRHRVLTPDEADAAWTSFARAHPYEARLAARVLGWTYAPTPSGWRDFARAIRLVAFRPADDR